MGQAKRQGMTMNVGGDEERSSADAAGSAPGLHPVPLHALHQTQRSVGHSILLLPGNLLVIVHQLVHKAVNVQTGIYWPVACIRAYCCQNHKHLYC